MTTQPLAVGATIAFQHGRVVVRLQRVRPAAYTVTVEQGTLRLHGLCRAFSASTSPPEQEYPMPECLWADAGHGPCQGGPKYRVVLRSPDRQTVRDVEGPLCFGHALAYLDRANAAGSIAVPEFEEIEQ